MSMSTSAVPTIEYFVFQIFLSKSYDATSHFETTCIDVLDIFRRATGADFDFSKVKHNLEDIEWQTTDLVAPWTSAKSHESDHLSPSAL